MHAGVSPRLLALADAGAIVVFAAIGQLSHDGGLSAGGFARAALPILAGWFGVALLARAYRGGGLRALALTWALGVPLGVGVRALVLGRDLDDRQAAFAGTTLAFMLFAVTALRLVVRAWAQLAGD